MTESIGRPTLFTPEVRQKILNAVKAGNYNDVAAKAAGVSRRCFYRWLAQGRKEQSGEYRDFWHALMEAQNSAEIAAVAAIREAGNKEPKYCQWWLERKFPERWGRDTFQVKKLQREVSRLACEIEKLLAKEKLSREELRTRATETLARIHERRNGAESNATHSTSSVKE